MKTLYKRKRAYLPHSANVTVIWSKEIHIKILQLIGVSTFVSAVFFAHGSNEYQMVHKVAITGSLSHTDEQKLTEALRPLLKDGLLIVDLKTIRDHLEAIPSVFSATVRRRWFEGLDIHLVEQTPIARWGEHQLINHMGHVFQLPEGYTIDNDLPKLEGSVGSSSEVIAIYLRTKEILSETGDKIVALSAGSLGQLKITLVDGVEIYLSKKDFLNSLLRFAILRNHLHQKKLDIQRVDLRYKNGMAVVLKGYRMTMHSNSIGVVQEINTNG